MEREIASSRGKEPTEHRGRLHVVNWTFKCWEMRNNIFKLERKKNNLRKSPKSKNPAFTVRLPKCPSHQHNNFESRKPLVRPGLTNLSLHILPPKDYSTHSYFQHPQLDNKKPLILAYDLVQALYTVLQKNVFFLTSCLFFWWLSY